MGGKVWRLDENDILKALWNDSKKDYIIQSLPNRTWASCIIQASKLGLKRDKFSFNVFPKKSKSSLLFLLNNIPLSYYWMGFILADGFIDHDDSRFKLTLAMKDKKHLIKLARLLKTNHRKGISKIERKEHKNISISVKDTKNIALIIKKFDLSPRKTYNPPTELKIENDDLFLSLLIGFIDGDGCIRNQSNRKDCILRVKCHSSWLNILQEWFDRLYKLAEIADLNIMSKNKNQVRLNNYGYANINIGNSKVLAFLKNKIKELNLPVLERKWNKVNVEYSKYYENGKIKKEKIIQLSSQGIKNREIAKLLDVGDAYVSIILKKSRKEVNHG